MPNLIMSEPRISYTGHEHRLKRIILIGPPGAGSHTSLAFLVTQTLFIANILCNFSGSMAQRELKLHEWSKNRVLPENYEYKKYRISSSIRTQTLVNRRYAPSRCSRQCKYYCHTRIEDLMSGTVVGHSCVHVALGEDWWDLCSLRNRGRLYSNCRRPEGINLSSKCQDYHLYRIVTAFLKAQSCQF